MRKAMACVLFMLLGAIALVAAPADVTYTEGDANLRLSSGKSHDVEIGDVMNTGDTLRTGKDGQAELDQKGVTIKISHGTVFTLMEKNQAGQTATVLSVALGSIKFRYDKLTGSEPQVRTNGAVAGVRGTEFTVYSGADGSARFAVDSGQVTVESGGKSVDLVADEGVDVPLGKPPGDKFTSHSNQIDYSKWNDDKLNAMLADPISALTTIQGTMEEYSRSIADYYATYQEYKTRLDAEKEKRAQLSKEKGVEEGNRYQQDVVIPLNLDTGHLFINFRFYSLAALSLRRYVAGRLYLYIKSQYIADTHAPGWNSFLDKYNELLSSFEQSIVPRLVEDDI